MQAKKLLAAPILVLALLGGFLAGYSTSTGNTSQALENTMHVELYLYKNGKLVYYDPDDPTTANMLNIFVEMAKNAGQFTARDGSTFNGIDTQLTGSMVCASNGTATFTRNMHVLPGTEWCSSTPLTVTINGNELIMSGTVNIASTTNITWVGLYLKTDSYPASNGFTGRWFLLAADPIDQPIHVNSGDVISIVYKFVFP